MNDTFRIAAFDFNLTYSSSQAAYVYSNANFFPIDNRLLGNYANSGHNFGFTTEVHTQFW